MSLNVPIGPPPAQGHPLRFPIVTFITLFLIVFFLKSTTFSDPSTKINNHKHTHQPHSTATNQDHPSRSSSSNCLTSSKLPASVSQILIHYATTNTKPQQTIEEISVTERVLRLKSPCNFLVFGLGYDSLMWIGLNHGGRTLFLEENMMWIDEMERQFPGQLVSRHVNYSTTTQVKQADELLRRATSGGGDTKNPCSQVVDPRESKCELALKDLPDEVYEVEWDLIMVDGPTGYSDYMPGRMTAIYTAGLLARNKKHAAAETHVFLHDVDRVVEDKFSKTFLCEGYLKEEVARLRHFVVPSQRDSPGTPFCPPLLIG